jgi:hypothetical protein
MALNVGSGKRVILDVDQEGIDTLDLPFQFPLISDLIREMVALWLGTFEKLKSIERS